MLQAIRGRSSEEGMLEGVEEARKKAGVRLAELTGGIEEKKETK